MMLMKTKAVQEGKITMKILLIAHGEFTTYLLKSAEMILGTQDENSVAAINFYPQDSMEALKKRVTEKLEDFQGEDILFLTDLRGGTPCNVSFLLSKQYKIHLLTGLNLTMLLEALLSKDEAITDELIEKIAAAGRDGVQVIK